MLHLVLYLIPLCLGRVMDSPPYQEIGLNKIMLNNRDASKRALQPTLNIRNSPEEFLEVMAGETKFLECEAGGTPPPTIHWLKNGQKIHQSLYETIDTSENGEDVMESELGLGFTRSRLYLDCISPGDAGRYSCVAENTYIRAFKNSQVFVADTIEANNDARCLARKKFDTPARIHMWTHTRLEMMGTDVQLFCRHNGDPKPRIIWRGPNKQLLNDPNKYQIMPNGDLIIRKIMWSDMGGYSCQTKNSEGVDEAVVFLYPTLPDDETDV